MVRIDQLAQVRAGTHLEGRGLAPLQILDTDSFTLLIERQESDLLGPGTTRKAC